MARTPQKSEKKSDVETEPDAWDRFKGAIQKIVRPRGAPKKEQNGAKDYKG